MRPGDAQHRFEQIATAASPGQPVRRVIVGDDPRRRAAVLVGGGRRAPAAVVKIARTTDEGDRGSDEQRRLRELDRLDVGDVPQPLGSGTTDGLAWSVEAWAPGVPWDAAPWVWRRRHERRLLDRLAAWLDLLATRTRHDRPGAVDDEQLPLREPATTIVAPLRAALAGAPAVLVHGDLASGTNVLVHRGSFTVIDWETAIADGLPLVDLVPTLTLALARAAAGDAAARADRALAICRGDADESRWLFDAVARHLTALQVDPGLAGPLAVAAWGYQASMRARHDELVLAAGGTPLAWTSPAEIVLDEWLRDERLGTEWRAFAPSRS